MRDRLVRELLIHEGSTRAVGLARILFAPIAWSRFAHELMPFVDLSPDRVALGALFYVATSLMLVGWHARLATAATAACMVAMVFGYGEIGGHEPWTHHHTHALTMLVVWLALTPNDRSFSLDRWLAIRRAARRGAAPPEERGDLWGTRLVLVQLSAVYLWSGINKATTPAFLSGARLEHLFHQLYWGSDPFPFPGLQSAVSMASALSVVALELALAFGLWRSAWHRVLMPLGVLMHATIYVTLPVYTFSATMVAAYLVVLDPAVVHRFVDVLVGGPGTGAAPRAGSPRPPGARTLPPRGPDG